MAANRANRWMHGRGIGTIAGLYQVGAAFVVSFLADDRTNERNRLHLLGQLLQTVCQFDASRGRGNRLRVAANLRTRLGIERLKLTGTALHPEHNQRLRRLTASDLVRRLEQASGP